MVLSWSKRNVLGLGRVRKGNKEQVQSSSELEVEEIAIPSHFRCPVSLDLMKDPVTLPTGITYDRVSIEKWIEAGNKTCPVTNQTLNQATSLDNIIPNHTIRKLIQDWCVQNPSCGIQRIPTPRAPLSKHQLSDACAKILAASNRRDASTCLKFFRQIRAWGRESERNKRCIVENGAAPVLARAFESFSVEHERNVVVLEELLEVLTWTIVIPFGEECKLCSQASLSSLVWFLDGQDLAARKNAALLLREVVCVRELPKVEGVFEALVKMVREPIGTVATKACLVTIFKMVSENKEGVAQRFVELGLVSLLLDAIVEGEKGICEKALGVLDCICDSKEGKEVVKSNALTLPLVVKKILRVSQLASCFAVSVLRKICVDKREEGVLIEALQVGAFQKLLVMLQVGCDEKTKENATELLKLLNAYRSKADCVDSSSLDFKYLQKPF